MKIGLALSGGGVLGAAHIGPLEEVERNHIKIDMICGASSGAILGALFAVGGTAKINAFLEDLEYAGVFDRKKFILNPKPTDIFEQVRAALKKHLDDMRFEEMPIKFSCIATDIVTGERIIFDSGRVVESIMASAAYPGVFPSQNCGNILCVDGGICNNLPASTLRERGMDFIIGSSLYNVSKFEHFDDMGNLKANPIVVAMRAIDIMQKQLAEYEIKNCDFCFTPPVETYSWYSFDRLADILKLGQEYAKARTEELLKNITDCKPKKSLFKRLFRE